MLWGKVFCFILKFFTYHPEPYQFLGENSQSYSCFVLFSGHYECCIQQFLGGVGFSTSIARRKTFMQPGSLRWCCKPSPVRSRGDTLEIFWLFHILNSSKHHSLGSVTRNVDKSLHQKSTLLSVWGFEFGIPNRYTGFEIALDMALITY